MVVTKRKKVRKYRAQTTHGGGHRKKRRGAGSRGGRGRAGSGKRAGHKKLKLGRKKGFLPRRSYAAIKTINVDYFTPETVAQLLKEGKIIKTGDSFKINLSELGYQKLLGTGNTDLRLVITVPLCSERAAEKIKAGGGEVISASVSLSGKIPSKKLLNKEDSVDRHLES